MVTTPADRHTETALDKLIALSRNAHVNVDLDDPADYWYRLGQRNAYAHAVGVVVGRGVDQAGFEVADRITAALAEGEHRIDALRDAALRSQDQAAPHPAVEWLGPQAFLARYGPLDIEPQFGTQWGARGNQQVYLHTPPGENRGLLYAHDPLWDEYAVLGTDAAQRAVEAAYRQALESDPHMDVAAFAELVRAHTLTAVPSRDIRVGREVEL
jgi:hypothetical protein